MSQHLVHAVYGSEPVQVLMGFDRPLNGFFLVVERLVDRSETGSSADAEETGAYVYSNLEDGRLPTGMARDVGFLDQVLKELGIAVPRVMLEEVARDGALRVGNKQCWYDSTGAVLKGRPGSRETDS